MKQEKTDNKSIHYHLIIIYDHKKRHPATILKSIAKLITADRSKKKQLSGYDVMDSNKCITYSNYQNLNYEKYDVWFKSTDQREKYSGKPKTYVTITDNNLNKVFCWISYLAKVESSYGTRSLMVYDPEV